MNIYSQFIINFFRQIFDCTIIAMLMLAANILFLYFAFGINPEKYSLVVFLSNCLAIFSCTYPLTAWFLKDDIKLLTNSDKSRAIIYALFFIHECWITQSFWNKDRYHPRSNFAFFKQNKNT